MRKMITIIFLIFQFIGSSQSWENLTNKDGVYAFDEDDSYLWIGTSGGLIKLNKQTRETETYYRADKRIPDNCVLELRNENNSLWLGSRFSGVGVLESGHCDTYNSENSNLPHNQYNTAIAIDLKGNKYFGSLGYLSKFDGTDFEIIKEMDLLVSFDNVNDIEIINEDSIWIACYSGLFKYDGINVDFIDEVFGSINSIAADENDNLWASSSNGLYKYSNGNWSNYNTANSDLIRNELQEISLDENNNLWIAAYDYLISYSSSGEWTNYECTNEDIGDFKIFTIYIDNDSNFWIGTRKNGLLLFKNGVFEKVDYSTPSILPSNAVSIELLDNTIWFGWNNGLFNLEGIHLDTINSTLPYPEVNLKAADSDGNLWLQNTLFTSTPEGVISDSKLFKFNGFDFEEFDTPFALGWSILMEIDDNGNFWFGISGDGIYKWDGLNWTHFNSDNSPLTSNTINAIDFDSQGNIWIGQNEEWDEFDVMIGGGLVKYDGNNTWQEYNITNSELPYNCIKAIYVDKKDVVWLGTVAPSRINGGGLTRFDGESWQSYTKNNSDISDNQVLSILEDSDGIIWSGTMFGGLVGYNKIDRWDVYMQHNSGIAINYVNKLLIDVNNKIWMRHNVYSGVSVFDKNATGINVQVSPNKNSIKVYPNPTSECIIIESLNQIEKIKSIKIFEITGKLIYKQNFSERSTKIKLNIQDFCISDTGIIIIEVKTDNSIIRKKMIIKS